MKIYRKYFFEKYRLRKLKKSNNLCRDILSHHPLNHFHLNSTAYRFMRPLNILWLTWNPPNTLPHYIKHIISFSFWIFVNNIFPTELIHFPSNFHSLLFQFSFSFSAFSFSCFFFSFPLELIKKINKKSIYIQIYLFNYNLVYTNTYIYVCQTKKNIEKKEKPKKGT